MTVAVPPSAFVAQPAIEDYGWRRHAVALAISVAMLVILFGRDSTDLARIWWTSTTFGHCLFIGPVLGWLVWQRRNDLAALRPVAWHPVWRLSHLADLPGLWERRHKWRWRDTLGW